MVCQKSQQTGIKFEANKPEDIRQVYKINNKSRRERQIADIGIEAVREIEKVAKQKLRSNIKANEEKDEVVLPEALLNHLLR